MNGMHASTIERNRERARTLRQQDRALAAGMAVGALVKAIKDCDTRGMSTEARRERSVSFSSWSLRGIGSHR